MKQCTDDLTEITRIQISENAKQHLEIGFSNNLKYKIENIYNNQTQLCILLNYIRL
jgi:hypothetical protein